jgi:hypothetical protein
VDVDAVLAGLYELVAPHLTEKQRRLLAGAAARALGRGGGARMARIGGLSRPTVYTGVRELDDAPDRAAASGGRVAGPSGWSSVTRGCSRRWRNWLTPIPAETLSL